MTTRIADLPPLGNEPSQQTGGAFSETNTYAPINLHPNPYGYEDATVSAVGGGGGPGIQTREPRNGGGGGGGGVGDLTAEQIQMLQTLPPQKVPSRDIQINHTQYTHDEKTVPNYIPPARTERDYIKEYEMDNAEKRRAHQNKKNQSRTVDWVLEQIQFPLTISILYFIFQYPMIDNLLFKRLDGLVVPLFHTGDGTMNLYGNIAKSVLFGAGIYFILQTTNYISAI